MAGTWSAGLVFASSPIRLFRGHDLISAVVFPTRLPMRFADKKRCATSREHREERAWRARHSAWFDQRVRRLTPQCLGPLVARPTMDPRTLIFAVRNPALDGRNLYVIHPSPKGLGKEKKKKKKRKKGAVTPALILLRSPERPRSRVLTRRVGGRSASPGAWAPRSLLKDPTFESLVGGFNPAFGRPSNYDAQTAAPTASLQHLEGPPADDARQRASTRADVNPSGLSNL